MQIKETNGRHTVLASQYLQLDADPDRGGGTDQTEQVQAILDKAVEWGSLTLIMDGMALVHGLRIHSNTTIRCRDRRCGFYLADYSDCPLLQNAQLDYYTIRQENITLLGGTYHFNCEHQNRVCPPSDPYDPESVRQAMLQTNMGFKFIGVRNLTIDGVRTVDQKIYAIFIVNFEHVRIENTAVDLPHNYYAQNQDGIHFWGPGHDVVIRDVRGGSGDDFLAFTPDEHDCQSSITDVLVDGVYMEDADQGVRMLSRGPGRLDRVTVRNVYGTFKGCGFFLNPWFGVGCGDSKGNYGRITIENVDLRTKPEKYGEYCHPVLFRIGGEMESLTLRHIACHDPEYPFPIVEACRQYGTWKTPASHTHIAQLTVDGLSVYNRKGTAEPMDYVRIDAPVDQLIIRNVTADRTGNAAPDTVLHLDEAARVGICRLEPTVTEGIGQDVAAHPQAQVERWIR